jgi:hypothetical protein
MRTASAFAETAWMRTVMSACVLMVLVSATHAQQADEVLTRLLRARSLRCEFQAGTQASWDGGSLKLKQVTAGEGGRMTFDSIDTRAGKARMIGNVGAVDVRVLMTVTGLTFVEETHFGNLNFTTVFGSYDSSRRVIAVSSRHQDINGPFPSQYHGTCSVLD